MKTSKALLIVSIIAGVVLLIGYIIMIFVKKELFLKKIGTFIQRWEGDKGRGVHDNASSFPAPWEYEGKTGWHTSRGVTFRTFSLNASKLGYKVTPENFFNMPDSIWWAILSNVIMKPWNLDAINHLSRIQAVIIDWSFNSGPAGAERYLANFQRQVMGIKDSNITKQEIVDNFKKYVTPLNEKEIFLALCQRRKEDYAKMSDFQVYGRGWFNRVESLKKEFA